MADHAARALGGPETVDLEAVCCALGWDV